MHQLEFLNYIHQKSPGNFRNKLITSKVSELNMYYLTTDQDWGTLTMKGLEA